MRTFFNDLSSQLKGIWGRLDGGQRLVVASVLLATVVGLGAIVWFAGQPSYVRVHTTKSGDEIAAASRALEQNGINWIPDESGWGIMVDSRQSGVARVALRQAGVMSEAGDDGLNASSIIDDAQTKAFKLANASIARAEAAVREVEGVAAVRITASPPRRQRAFVDKARESRPTATVLVKLRMGTPFETTAHTAASLTASQLGIPIENVTVSNAAGGARWRFDPDRSAGGGSSEFMSTQRGIAREKTELAQQVLDQLWPGKATVVVNVELDPSWEVVSEKVVPTEGLLKSEKTTKETSDQFTGEGNGGRSATAGGRAESSTKNETKNETKDKEYVTEIGERRSGKMAPEVRRLTVAVVYDRSLEDDQSFNKDDLAKNIKAMVGWDKDRDSEEDFSVMPGTFAPIDDSDLMTSEPGVMDLVVQWGPTIGQVLGVIVVIFFLRGLFKRSSPKPAGASAGVSLGRGSTLRGSDSMTTPERELSPEEQQKRMRREIERAIASDPAALAKLLESWLIEQGV
ncbi:MAG: hypothetical protein NXI31_16690 [bacterium]|nr:hypothetical protein [bacterium]